MANRRNVFWATMGAGIFLGAFIASADNACARSHHKHQRHRTHAVSVRPQPASFLVDIDTGTVMQSENADSLRYPASLTKMMTLYLTFEALNKNKLSLNETVPVSEHAASQPQTNIALQPGDRIAVKDAILSIVVRSANDSAVVLGEAQGGGSEEEFARKMTLKAHALGMNHTVFRNASGLPDPQQHTTARDMATLGLALRKNFPQYFPFFKTESFSYRGLTYVGHNHVMARYEGVDGIKTGYIRASGYNLVTSATHDNHHVIGVVLGGSTFRERDDKMIALLDKSFTQLATLPGSNRVQLASSGRRVSLSSFPSKSDTDDVAEGEGDRRYNDSATHTVDAKQDDTPAASAAEPVVASLSNNAGWGIQVGAYARMSDAEAAASHAIAQAPAELKGSTVSVTDDPTDTHPIHRARLVNITQNQADEACHKMQTQHIPCFAYHVN